MSLALVHSPADVVASLIVQLGLGTDPAADPDGAWPVYVAVEPSTPDEVMTVGNTQGMDDARTMPDGTLEQHYGFQVRVRSADEPAGYTRASAVRRAFAEVVRGGLVTLGGHRYLVPNVSKIGQVLGLGYERGTRRRLFTLNATLPLRMLS